MSYNKYMHIKTRIHVEHLAKIQEANQIESDTTEGVQREYILSIYTIDKIQSESSRPSNFHYPKRVKLKSEPTKRKITVSQRTVSTLESVYRSLGIFNKKQASNVMAEMYNNRIEKENAKIDKQRAQERT